MFNFKALTNRGVPEYYDVTTFELLDRLSAVKFRADFEGKGSLVIPDVAASIAGNPWVSKIVKTVGVPTVAGIANQHRVRIALDATSEKQDAVLYFGDQLNFDVTASLVWEARAALHVLPSASGVQSILGLQSAWIDGPDNASFYAQFAFTANGAALCRTKDGVATKSVASGVTVVADAFHIFRIDATDVTDVKFFIDGVQVGAGNGLAFAATGANAVLQPYFSSYKPSGTGVATVDVDYVKVFTGR